MFGLDVRDVPRLRVRRQVVGQRDSGGRQTGIADRQAARFSRSCHSGPPFFDVHDFDGNRTLRTGAHTGRRLPQRQTTVAHVALADDATISVVLRHPIRAIPGAVLTADAGVGAVLHDAGHRILAVGVHRTAAQTCRLDTVVASHRQIRPRGVRKPSAFDLADAPPVDRRRVAILLVARHHAALAADALLHVEVKSVLLARRRRPRWHTGVDRGRLAEAAKRRRTVVLDAIQKGDARSHLAFR
jgi:hypothetical protein